MGNVNSIAFSANGNRLFSAGSDGSVRVWNLRNQKSIATNLETKSGLKCIDVGPDGRTFAALGTHSNILKCRGNFDHEFSLERGYAQDVKFSKDGRWLSALTKSPNDGRLAIYELSTGKLHGRLSVEPGKIHYGPDCRKVISVGWQFRSGQPPKCGISVCEIDSMQEIAKIENPHGIVRISDSVAFDAGRLLAISGTTYDAANESHQRIIVYDLQQKKVKIVIDTEDHSSNAIDVSADGNTLVSIDSRKGIANIWDLRDGSLRESIRLCDGGHFRLVDVAVAPDGRHYATAMGNGTIYISRMRPAEQIVAAKKDIPKPLEQSPEKPWQDLIGKPAPEINPEQFLFGEPTTMADFKGKWVAIHFWELHTDQFIPAWMDMHDRLSDNGLEVIVFKTIHPDGIEAERQSFSRWQSEAWGGRIIPFRVALDSKEQFPIKGTRILTQGPTHAAYRVTKSRLGYRTPPVSFLIDPNGKIVQELPNRPHKRTIAEIANLMKVKPTVPEWEKAFVEEARLKEGQSIRFHPRPFSKTRIRYRTTNIGFLSSDGTVVTSHDQQGNVLSWRASSITKQSVEEVLRFCLNIDSYEIQAEKQLKDKKVSGDWSVLRGSKIEDRVTALNLLFQNEFQWNIQVQQELAELESIQVTGKWKQASLNQENDGVVYFSLDESPKPMPGEVGGTTSLDEMLDWIGKRIRIRMENQVDEVPGAIEWREVQMVQHLEEIHKRSQTGIEKLELLIERLSKQTGLKFTRQKRETHVWRVSRIGE